MEPSLLSEDPSLDCDTLLRNSLRNAISTNYLSEENYDELIDYYNVQDPIIKNLVCNTVKIVGTFSLAELTSPSAFFCDDFNYITNSPTRFTFAYAIWYAHSHIQWLFNIPNSVNSPRNDIPTQQFLAGLIAKFIIFILCNNNNLRHPDSIYPLTSQHRDDLNNLFNTVNHGGIYNVFGSSDWGDVLYNMMSIESNSISTTSFFYTLTHVRDNCIFNSSFSYMLDNRAQDSYSLKISNFFNSYKEAICSSNRALSFCTPPIQLVCRRPVVRIVPQLSYPRDFITVSWTSVDASGNARVTIVPRAKSQDLPIPSVLNGSNGSIKYELYARPSVSSVPDSQKDNKLRYTITVTTQLVTGETVKSTVIYEQPLSKRK